MSLSTENAIIVLVLAFLSCVREVQADGDGYTVAIISGVIIAVVLKLILAIYCIVVRCRRHRRLREQQLQIQQQQLESYLVNEFIIGQRQTAATGAGPYALPQQQDTAAGAGPYAWPQQQNTAAGAAGPYAWPQKHNTAAGTASNNCDQATPSADGGVGGAGAATPYYSQTLPSRTSSYVSPSLDLPPPYAAGYETTVSSSDKAGPITSDASTA